MYTMRCIMYTKMNYAGTISVGRENNTASQGRRSSLLVFSSCPAVLTRCFLTMVAAACTERLLLGGWVVVSAVWSIWFFHAANYLDQ